MSSWRECKLGDLLEIKHGYVFLGKHFANAGSHIVLTPGSFYDEGGFKDKAEKEKWYNGPIPTEYVLDAGDIVVAMTEQAEGLLGSSAIVPRSGVYLHNQRLGLVRLRDESKTDKRFVYYLFNTKSVRQQIRASASGVKIRHTAPTRIAEVRVGVPPFPVQRRIASILSSYDDLIENNTRRIKILEEMAQMIYREWFVNFRFPGHEKTKMVESEMGPIPLGWKPSSVGELAKEERRNIQPGEIDQETPYIGLEHMPRGSIALSEWGVAGNVQSTKLEFRQGEILFGKIRPYFHKVGIAPIDGVCSSDVIVILPKKPEWRSVVLCCVSSKDFVSQATQTSQGTKMPRANWDVLTRYPIPLPAERILTCFNEIILPIIDLIKHLIFSNRNLRQTRDLLLPRLIVGQIVIKHFDNKAVIQI
jgi:type I restriction enzyme S subunit